MKKGLKKDKSYDGEIERSLYYLGKALYKFSLMRINNGTNKKRINYERK